MSADGLMNDSYARDREVRPALAYRYRFRALAAVKAAPGMLNGRLLDLGAAEGRTLAEMARLAKVRKAVGVELSPELVHHAQKLGHPVIAGDVERLPPHLLDASFDVVTALALLEHLEHPEACLRQAFEALRPGGRLVASAPNPFWDEAAARTGLHKEQAHHVRAITPQVFADLARQAGFVDIRMRPFMFVGTAFLPYLGISPPVSLAYALETPFSVSLLGPAFVNQLFVADKP